LRGFIFKTLSLAAAVVKMLNALSLALGKQLRETPIFGRSTTFWISAVPLARSHGDAASAKNCAIITDRLRHDPGHESFLVIIRVVCEVEIRGGGRGRSGGAKLLVLLGTHHTRRALHFNHAPADRHSFA
jgi:hypothetical protein